MSLNKAAKSKSAERIADEGHRKRKDLVTHMIFGYLNDNPKIKALNELGMNDTKIGLFINKTQGSVHGYRASQVQPPAEIDELLDEMLQQAIDVVEVSLQRTGLPPIIARILRAKVAFAKKALDQ